ncbi:hypothetical protein OG394_19050 [Kribbella sp. NBC_01245]|uniref:hypothetical protein n=1 Tax=Kribbella sp. NBC_01245 TaxID=2903578 RepID=UPI002E27ADE8|nr:hypothetical protein [Kribbella sp. NBC_01245]
MSEHGANRRPHSRRKNQSKGLKPFVILGAILAVVAPIAWILGQETGGGSADGAIPYVNRDDDSYNTPDHEIPIVDSTPGDVPSKAPTPTTKPSTPGVTPTPTPGETTTPGHLNSETPVPTTAPTERPTSTDTVPPTSRPTTSGRPTPTPTETSTTSSPTPTATETTRTPTDNGGMENFEFELFSTLNGARESEGCAPLKRNTSLTKGARADAAGRAKSGEVDGRGASYAAVGGKGMTAKGAADRLLQDHRSTVLNCDLTTLGVGRGDHTYTESGLVCSIFNTCPDATRFAWVVDFT